jgi:hypothetical protein
MTPKWENDDNITRDPKVIWHEIVDRMGSYAHKTEPAAFIKGVQFRD